MSESIEEIDDAVASSVSNPLDLKRFRLRDNTRTTITTVKQTLVVPVQRPGRQTWFRIRPGEEWECEVPVIEDQETRATYVVAQELAESLGTDVVMKTLRTGITRAGSLFLWPLRIADSDGRQDRWSESARASASNAEMQWTRITANMSDGQYDIHSAAGDLPEPVWPEDLSFQRLFELGFKDFVIDDEDHPILAKLMAKV